MDVDPPSSTTGLSYLHDFHIGSPTTTMDLPDNSVVVCETSAPTHSRHRSLRARPANPMPASASALEPTSPVAHLRKASTKELDNIARRLGPEGVALRRAEVLKENERALKAVVEGHDAAVREKFHLERFVTLLEGWDPEVSSSIFPSAM